MRKLTIVSSSPAMIVDEKLFLDVKFVEGMRFYSRYWHGPVACLLKSRSDVFPFSKAYDPSDLPFEVVVIPNEVNISEKHLFDSDIIIASGDDHESLDVGRICRANGKKIAFSIENIPETRRKIVLLDRERTLAQKAYSLLWMVGKEAQRWNEFRRADAVQANGYPAFSLYRALNKNTILYFDSRMSATMFATEEEMDARCSHLASGAPVRLVHSGRLEPLKGSQDLISIARHLQAMDVRFVLDIFGTGSLEAEMRSEIAHRGLQHCVRLHGAVDFETELVPYIREQSDVYLSCHRQSDPSCTYLENMGCGVAVVGYDNKMWSALCKDSGAGWLAPTGNTRKLADLINVASSNRSELVNRCIAARDFSIAHSFESEFRLRLVQLESLF
jgi:glycosyltransferase involved in cell wall biosynthesis